MSSGHSAAHTDPSNDPAGSNLSKVRKNLKLIILIAFGLAMAYVVRNEIASAMSDKARTDSVTTAGQATAISETKVTRILHIPGSSTKPEDRPVLPFGLGLKVTFYPTPGKDVDLDCQSRDTGKWDNYTVKDGACSKVFGAIRAANMQDTPSDLTVETRPM